MLYKKIKYFLVFCLFLSNLTKSQMQSISLNLKILEDTSNSVFSQNFISVLPDGIQYLPSSTEADYNLMVYGNRDSNNIEIRIINQTDWMPILSEDTFMRVYFPTTYFIYPEYQLGAYLNLLPVYDQNNDFWNIAKNGCNIEVRYKNWLLIDSFPPQYYYSNLDTLVIPPASNQDIHAFEYLQENNINIKRFANLEYGIVDPFYERNTYIIDNFPNSMIAEISRFNLSIVQTYEVLGSGDEINYQNLYSQMIHTFSSSPSGLIREYINQIKTLHRQ